MARKLTKAEKDLFQFLIGKVQLKETRKKAVKRLVISFNSSQVRYNVSICAIYEFYYYRFFQFLQVFSPKSRSIFFYRMPFFIDFTAFLQNLIFALKIDRLFISPKQHHKSILTHPLTIPQSNFICIPVSVNDCWNLEMHKKESQFSCLSLIIMLIIKCFIKQVAFKKHLKNRRKRNE